MPCSAAARYGAHGPMSNPSPPPPPAREAQIAGRKAGSPTDLGYPERKAAVRVMARSIKDWLLLLMILAWLVVGAGGCG
jgi:hypothetical protein